MLYNIKLKESAMLTHQSVVEMLYTMPSSVFFHHQPLIKYGNNKNPYFLSSLGCSIGVIIKFPWVSMSIANDIQQQLTQMHQWRQPLRPFPETTFEETKIAKYMTDKLINVYFYIHQGLDKTGVVTTLSAGNMTKKSLCTAL
jgi:hypothetical protein